VVTEITRSLNVVERRHLKKLEEVVERGVESFLATGSALKEIRDDRLYREDHKTFESYVKAKWGFERAHAYRLIESSDIKKDLSPMGDKIPKAAEINTERQLRELKNIPSDAIEAVVEKAAEIAGDAPITAKVLKEAREQVMSYEDAVAKPEPKAESPQALAAPIQAVATHLDGLHKTLKKLSDDCGGEWLDLTDIGMKIDALKHVIRSAVYWVDCPDCAGKGCNTCKKHGWLSRNRKQFLTQEQKDKLGV
jgi:hypothetical protein